MFTGCKLMFTVRKHKFMHGELMFIAREHKFLRYKDYVNT